MILKFKKNCYNFATKIKIVSQLFSEIILFLEFDRKMSILKTHISYRKKVYHEKPRLKTFGEVIILNYHY